MAENPVNLGGTISDFPFVGNVEGDIGGNTSASQSPKEIFQNLGTGQYQGRDPISVGSFYTGDRFNTALPNADTEEMAAQQQSNWNKLGNGVLKMGGSFLTSFTAGTVGAIYGTGKAIADQRFSSLFDNELTRGLDKISKDLENTLPNYYTHTEKDADWWTPDNLMTTNFWADKVIKNIGFSLGAIAGGVAWGGALKAVGLTGKLVKAGKSLELINAAEQIATTVPKAQQWSAWQNALNGLSKTITGNVVSPLLKNSDRIIASAMGTFGEASIEALQSLNGFRDELIAEYKATNGLAPEGADLKEINEYADKVGNFVWGFNTLLLTGTNYIMLPKILGSSRKMDKIGINSIVKDKTGNYVASRSLLSKTASGVGYLFSGTEAFEEGSQYAIEKGVSDYFGRSYNNKEETKDFLTNLSGAFKGTIDEGITRTLTDKEGLESIFIGGITGALMTVKTNIKESSEKRKNTDLALGVLNSEKASIKSAIKGIKDQVDYAARALGSQKLRQQAIANNDILNEKDYELDYLMSYILPRIKYGKEEAIKQELGLYLDQVSTQEGFDQLKASGMVSQEETRDNFINKLNKIQDLSNYSSHLYENISDKYSNIIDKEGNPIYTTDAIDRMVYSAAKVKDYDARIGELTMPLLASNIDVQTILDNVIKNNTPPKREIEKALEEIKKKGSIEEEELKDTLKDVLELSLRRKDFVDTYNNIKAFPQNYKQVEELLAPSIKNDKGEEEAVEVSREYELPNDRVAMVRKRDDNQFEVIFPTKQNMFYATQEEADDAKDTYNEELKDRKKVKIVATNPDGSVRIEDMNGDVYDILPSTLQHYVKVATPQELLAKNKSELDQQQEEITKDSGNTYTGDPNVDITLIQTEDKKKNASTLFKATTGISEDREEANLKPHHLRVITLLNNAKNFDNRDKLRAVLLSINQEEALGLSGIVALSNNDSSGDPNKHTDLNTGTIIAVYVEQDGKDIYFIDQDGKRLGKLGDQQDLNKIVFSTMPTTHLFWGDGKTARYREDQKEEATIESKRWEAKRKEIFESKIHGGISKFTISRGIPVLSETDEQFSVSESLIPENKISTTEGLIQIATTGTISHNGVLLKYPNGRPVLQYQDTLQFINNKNLSPSQVDTIYKILEKISNTINMQSKMGEKIVIFKKYTAFLQNVLFYRDSSKKTFGNNQMFIDTDTMELRLGEERYDITDIAGNKEAILEQLKGVYHSINNTSLTTKFHEPFVELYLENDELKERTWKNYQTYLLSNKFPNKQKRNIKDIPLSTNVMPASEAVPYSYKQKYAVLDELDLPEIAIKPAKVEVKTPTKPTAGEFVLDGKTSNTYNLKSGPVQFTATIENGKASVAVQANESLIKISVDDVVMTGIIAQLKAIDKFDATKENINLVLDYVSYVIGGSIEAQLSTKTEETKTEETNIEDAYTQALSPILPELLLLSTDELGKFTSSKEMLAANKKQVELKKKYDTLEQLKKCLWT